MGPLLTVAPSQHPESWLMRCALHANCTWRLGTTTPRLNEACRLSNELKHKVYSGTALVSQNQIESRLSGENPGSVCICVSTYVFLLFFWERNPFSASYFAHGFEGQHNGMVRKYPHETCVILSGKNLSDDECAFEFVISALGFDWRYFLRLRLLFFCV